MTKLDKTYKGGENYTIYIDYISKPNEVKVKGSAAINDAKGLYFINPKGEEKDKPTQIWTQGETEATSVWCPTIDKPNQKTTQEMYMTVPAKYVTLSNGLLLSQKKNTDGTRTDYWKMDLPHAPYLFFMGVGEFSIIKDSYKGKEVSYYVEKDQAPYARAVFGLTPEMIKFFSDRLGVDYPWQKYAQMVGRDYVSGAMENTTATLHQESAYQNARELTDGIGWESTIAHELFHQWFGDLVTTESWSNITVNESMADYSETLWFEYKYGRDKGDEQNQQDRRRYLSDPNNAKKDLVRFYYADKEDVFDNVSYPKGGAIHHMLRNYVGDDAYFKSLNNYLTTNKFKPGEAHQMRLAFEEVTGKDLSWFWNQWFFGSGHPIVKVDYNYDEPGKAKVIVEQTQTTGKIFKLPIAIDVYTGASKKRYTVWVENKIDTFSFNYTQKPDLINVDADKVMLWAKTDNKTNENFVHQWKYAPLFMDRSEALDYFNRKSMPELAEGLKDKFAPLRRSTVNRLGQSAKFKADPAIIQSIENLANTEKEKTTKAAAIAFLAKTKDTRYKSLYDKNINDSSYSVAGAALTGLKELEPAKAYDLAKKYSSDAKGDLGDAINEVLMAEGTEADFDLLASRYEKMPLSQEKVGASATFAGYLEKVQNIANVKKGIDLIIKFRNLVPEQFRSFVDPTIKGGLSKLSKAKGKEIEDYIGDKLK
jgi:aminopeptidase N